MTTTVGSGLGASIGFAVESTYGTFVAPTKFYEFNDEGLSLQPVYKTGEGLRGGVRFRRGSQRVRTSSHVAGQLKLPAYFKGMGLLWAHTLGSTAVPVQQGVTAAYLQTHVEGINQGMSLSVQVLRPDTTGTQRAYSYSGVKIEQLDIENGLDELVMCTFGLEGQQVSEAPVATNPTFVTPNPEFHFAESTFTIGAFGSETVAAMVRKAKISFKRPMDLTRYYLGGGGLHAEPIQNQFWDVTGSLDTDFVDKTRFADIFAADTAQSMILGWTGPTIASTFNYQLGIALPQIFYKGKPPTVNGPGIVQASFDFDTFSDDAHAPATITYQSTDTTL